MFRGGPCRPELSRALVFERAGACRTPSSWNPSQERRQRSMRATGLVADPEGARWLAWFALFRSGRVAGAGYPSHGQGSTGSPRFV